jgi:hypothetical protein
MSGEQREHIAAAIGMMDMLTAILNDKRFEMVRDIVNDHIQILQEMLDKDAGV